MIAAAVDIGTNSVKLTVGERAEDGSLTVLFDGTKITRLGKGVDSAGRISEEASAKTLDALSEFAEQAKSLGATKIAAVGTSALRDATNGPEIVAEAAKRLGGPVELIAGEREAALTFAAARQDPDIAAALRRDGIEIEQALFVTSDIGGGSTELVQGRYDGEILYGASLQLGAVRLTERTGFSDPVEPNEFQIAVLLADATLADVPVPIGDQPIVLIASGGTAANLAAIQAGLDREPLTFESIHASQLTLEQIEGMTAFLAFLPLVDRRDVRGLEPDRADVIVAGSIIQSRVMRRLSVESLTVSLRGLRYGLLYELLGQ